LAAVTALPARILWRRPLHFKPTVLWLVGEPGTGKTTLARELLGPIDGFYEKPKWTLAGVSPIASGVGPHGVAAAGHYKGTPFDGADTVPYSGAAECLETWRDLLAGRVQLTLFDGDRFSTGPTLDFFRSHAKGHRLKCVHLGDPEVAERYRSNRELAHKLKPQAAAFVKGRRTKASNFADRFPAGDVLHLRNLLAVPITLSKEILTWLETNL
jgi:hypothetical protein